MENNYVVRGMSAPKSFTLEDNAESNCWAVDGLPEGHYETLFKQAKDNDTFWKQNVTADVECDDTGVHGSPINGVVKNIFINGEQWKP